MVSFNFRGLIAPVFTAYNADMSLNLECIPQYAKYLNDFGIKGILGLAISYRLPQAATIVLDPCLSIAVCDSRTNKDPTQSLLAAIYKSLSKCLTEVNGTSGEGMNLTLEERKLSAEAWMRAAKQTNQHVMVQIGGVPLPFVLELAQHAEKIGVQSILCLPELYFKPKSATKLISYLKIVSEAAPNTPLLYYHIPEYTGVQIHMGKFLNEVSDKIPTFKGIKFTSTVLDEGIEAVNANGGKFAVFLGADKIMAGAFTLGFDSAIAATLNMLPQHGVTIFNEVQKSNAEKAIKEQNMLNEKINIITKHGTRSFLSSMKQAFNILTPFNVGNVRRPLENLNNQEILDMKTQLNNLN